MEIGKVELRRLFVGQVKRGAKMSESCSKFGISRTCGYKWLGRYEQEGESGLRDRSRRPRSSPNRTRAEVVEEIVRQREQHPSWGSLKLNELLRREGIQAPSERTTDRVLSRGGMIEKRAKAETDWQRFERSSPNQLWQIDYKSPVYGLYGARRVPLTVEDDCSRYLLGLWSLPDKTFGTSWPYFWDLFGGFGLPDCILSDNDPALGGGDSPSKFEVRLMRLGVEVIHGRAYHPQTQGKVERLHGTIQLDFLQGYRGTDLSDLQAGFDRFRQEYNLVRPHQALSLKVPGDLYRPSFRPRPKDLPEMEYPEGSQLRKVDVNGHILWHGRKLDIGNGVIKEWVEVRSDLENSDRLRIYYGSYLLMEIDEYGNKKRLRHCRREEK